MGRWWFWCGCYICLSLIVWDFNQNYWLAEASFGGRNAFQILFSAGRRSIFNELFTEFYTFLAVLVLFSILFFEFWEIKILCAHCPFYAEEGRILHCYGNYGSLKVWDYNPEPMSKSEKIQLIIGFILLIIILLLPSIFLVINKYYIWAIPPIIGLLVFGYVIKRFHCSKCFNFSCPFNNQPKWVIDEFLKRNPVMRKAWEREGWQIEEETS